LPPSPPALVGTLEGLEAEVERARGAFTVAGRDFTAAEARLASARETIATIARIMAGTRPLLPGPHEERAMHMPSQIPIHIPTHIATEENTAMLREQTIAFDDETAFVALKSGVHWLPFLTGSGHRVLGAVSADFRLVAQREVMRDAEATELREECWRILDAVDPQPVGDSSVRCDATLRGA
jgi:hypothetical protein